MINTMCRYDNTGGQINVYTLTKGRGQASADPSLRNTVRKTIAQIKDEALGRSQPSYFELKGTITMIKHDRDIWYHACSTSGCSKKVTQLPSGEWHCDRCNNTTPTCEL